MKVEAALNTLTISDESELNVIFDIFQHHFIYLEIVKVKCANKCVLHVKNNIFQYDGEFYFTRLPNNKEIKTRSPGYAGAIFAHRILKNLGGCSYCII